MKDHILSVKEKIGYGMGDGATLTIIIALFTLVPAVCYLLSAVIAKRYYTLKTPFLKKMMAELAEGARRNEQDFTAAPIDKEWQN